MLVEWFCLYVETELLDEEWFLNPLFFFLIFIGGRWTGRCFVCSSLFWRRCIRLSRWRGRMKRFPPKTNLNCWIYYSTNETLENYFQMRKKNFTASVPLDQRLVEKWSLDKDNEVATSWNWKIILYREIIISIGRFPLYLFQMVQSRNV